MQLYTIRPSKASRRLAPALSCHAHETVLSGVYHATSCSTIVMQTMMSRPDISNANRVWVSQAMAAPVRSRLLHPKGSRLPHVSSASCLPAKAWSSPSSRSMTPSITPPPRSRRRFHDPRASMSAGDWSSADSFPEDSDSGPEVESLCDSQILALHHAASEQSASSASPYWSAFFHLRACCTAVCFLNVSKQMLLPAWLWHAVGQSRDTLHLQARTS